MRKVEQLLERLVKSMEHIEQTLCPPRTPRPPMTPEALAAWSRKMKGGFRPVGQEGSDLPPSGGTDPREFWSRADEDAPPKPRGKQ